MPYKEKYTKPFAVSSLSFMNANNRILLNPDYQRNPVWVKSQKQLFIDSLFRDIDIPKIYFRSINRGGYEYEVVDGQQRLRAIFEFLKDSFELSKESDPVDGEDISEKYFKDLSTDSQVAFQNKTLDVVILSKEYTDDDIEEMFLRLQNGTPLNAAEKRRAMAGNMREIIKSLSRNRIFKYCIFKDTRYAYEDASAKIAHLFLAGAITDIKPSSIKKTYDDNKAISFSNPAIARVKKAFSFITSSFSLKPTPPILKKYSIISLSIAADYLLQNYDIANYKKEFADAYKCFEKKRAQNEELPEEKQDSRLSGYSNAARSDSIADMEYRHKILLEEFISSVPKMKLKDKNRGFTEEQRIAIFIQDKGICQECKKHVDESDFHIDHKDPHSRGGPTSLSNAQLLCPKCNREKSAKVPQKK